MYDYDNALKLFFYPYFVWYIYPSFILLELVFCELMLILFLHIATKLNTNQTKVDED
jgi:hypothetical protein